MIPALNPTERAAVVKGARATIAPAVFQVLLTQVWSVLSGADKHKLERALEEGDGPAANDGHSREAA